MTKTVSRFSVAGGGKQALTQVLAMKEIAALEATRIWSPHREHLVRFLARLAEYRVEALGAESLEEAFKSSDVDSTMTASREPFLRKSDVIGLPHPNVCGPNWADRAEVTPEALAEFTTITVDDLARAKLEPGDLIAAERRGLFSWELAGELRDVMSGKVKPGPKTLSKSNGIALEDVAVASMVYDEAPTA